MENVTQRKLVSGDRGYAWVTACGGQQGRVEAGSGVRLGCRFRVLLSPCLRLSGSFHFSKDGQAGLRKMSPSLCGYSQVFSAQWFKQPAFFVCKDTATG